MPDIPVNNNATHSSNVAPSGHSYKSFAEYRTSPRTEGNPLRLTVMLLYTVHSDTCIKCRYEVSAQYASDRGTLYILTSADESCMHSTLNAMICMLIALLVRNLLNDAGA
jgi:hypothetical protein